MVSSERMHLKQEYFDSETSFISRGFNEENDKIITCIIYSLFEKLYTNTLWRQRTSQSWFGANISKTEGEEVKEELLSDR